ncbi:MAG: peptide-methionine (S)-S-oxide reductase [Psychromonas sp.]|jgi:peptide-methionine (S)-S-oxide reductase|uniref:peptide-methionine (S)-S-oxide reductase MsrA n=1 Tax=Psychromonas sp. TaxID=1884585 RepID=UPI0039E42F61
MAISTANFAGGCFWCIEAAFNALKGVESAVSGYTGGETDSPTYEDICTGTTGHAEVVQIKFDDAVISYQELLTVFFSLHDATQLNRQGHDTGTQYRSAIFYHDLQQKQLAEEFLHLLEEKQIFSKSIKTTIDKLEKFYPAEDYHQGYFLKNPEQGYCSMVIQPKFNKFKEKYQAALKEGLTS